MDRIASSRQTRLILMFVIRTTDDFIRDSNEHVAELGGVGK